MHHPITRPTLVISPALDNLPRINTASLKDLQGNLKDLTKQNFERLAKSIEENTFFLPLFVWLDPANGTPYTLDGNQRLRYFRTVYPLGIELPYILVSADSQHEAKKKILLIDSKYGHVTKEGFDEFSVGLSNFSTFVGTVTTFSEFLDFDRKEQPKEPPAHVEFSTFLGEESNYVVLKFDTRQDWLQFLSLVDVPSVASQQSNGKVRSVGIGRVLDGPSVIDQLLQ